MNNSDSNKTIIILARHGECRGNREGLFRGRSDFPLNELGISQAKELAKELQQFKPDKIFTSPLSRAKQTADIIGQISNKEVEVRPDMNNIELGPWEGKSKDYIAQQYPEEWKTWINEPEELKIPGMEPLEQLKLRVREDLDSLIEQYYGKNIVIVSHRAVLKPLIASCLGIRKPYFWRVHLDTASYSILHYKKSRGFILVQLNQNKHLKEYISEWQ